MKAETVIGPVSIVEKAERPYLGIRLQTPFGGMFGEIAKTLKVLRRWSKANGVPDNGPYFVRYYHCDMSTIMDVEVCLMTPSAVPGDEGVKQGLLPMGKYATLVYRGNGLRGNQALMKWAVDNGVAFDPLVAGLAESYVCRYEAYLTDYRVESRKLLWDVELAIKVA